MTVRSQQSPARYQTSPASVSRSSDSLADILERVLDKGIVIAGDIMVNVLDIELLTLKVRLLIASVDTAREMGIDWWTTDPFLTGRKQPETGELERENQELRQRIEELERRMQTELPTSRTQATAQQQAPQVERAEGDGRQAEGSAIR